MKGHIRKRVGRRGISWDLVIDLGRDPETAKRRQKWQTVQGTKKEAEAALHRILHQLETGTYMEPGTITVGEYLRRWLQDYAKPNTAPKTYLRYHGIVEGHLIPALGSLKLSRLQPAHLQAYYAKALENGRANGRGGLSAQTVTHHHRVLREALQHAVRWQLAGRNVADAVKPPRPEKHEMVTLDRDGVVRLLAAAQGGPYYALLHTAIFTGMRLGELLGLRWQDVDLDRGAASIRQTLQRIPRQGIIVRTPKTPRSRRSVALPPSLVELLRHHRTEQLRAKLRAGPAWQDRGLVFTTALGTPLDDSHLRRDLRPVLKRAGLPHIRFHDLRHTHASMMLSLGEHPKIVSERLGHASVNITLDTYSHVLPGLQMEAARRLDGWLGQGLAGLSGGAEGPTP